MKTIVLLSLSEKSQKKLPKEIAIKLATAIDLIEERGIGVIRKIRSYNDEKLIGTRKGQRSFRLNRSWRAIYEESSDGTLDIIEIVEVNKHDY